MRIILCLVNKWNIAVFYFIQGRAQREGPGGEGLGKNNKKKYIYCAQPTTAAFTDKQF